MCVLSDSLPHCFYDYLDFFFEHFTKKNTLNKHLKFHDSFYRNCVRTMQNYLYLLVKRWIALIFFAFDLFYQRNKCFHLNNHTNNAIKYHLPTVKTNLTLNKRDYSTCASKSLIPHLNGFHLLTSMLWSEFKMLRKHFQFNTDKFPPHKQPNWILFFAYLKS